MGCERLSERFSHHPREEKQCQRMQHRDKSCLEHGYRSYGVANKSLSTTSCTVQEKDSADVVVDRVHDSIIDSSLGVVEFGDILGDPGSKLFPVVT